MNKWISYCVKEELNDNFDCTFPRPYILFWNVWMRLTEYCCSDSTILFRNSSKSQLCRIFIMNLWRQNLWSRIQSLLYGLIGEPQSPSSWKIIPYSSCTWNILTAVAKNYHSSFSMPIFVCKYVWEKYSIAHLKVM